MAKKVKAKAGKPLDRRALVKATDPAVLRKILERIGGDGHTIFPPEAITESGGSPELAAAFTREFESDYGDVKATVFVNGNPVEKLTGVYGLTVVECIAGVFGVTSWKEGRGSRCGHLTSQLLAKLKPVGPT